MTQVMISPTKFFKLLSDETRLRILTLLLDEKELCVCEFTHIVGISQPKISRHMALLRDAHVVIARRQATWIFYRINPQVPSWVEAVLNDALSQLKDQPPYEEDAEALQKLSTNPGLICCT